MTSTNSNRAMMASLLVLEFMSAQPGSHIDASKPVYIGRKGITVSVVFYTAQGYVMVSYQKFPLSTSYCLSTVKDGLAAKKALSAECDQVWEVPNDLFTDALTTLLSGIYGQ